MSRTSGIADANTNLRLCSAGFACKLAERKGATRSLAVLGFVLFLLLLLQGVVYAEPVMDDWDAGARPPIKELIAFPDDFQQSATEHFVFHYPRRAAARIEGLPKLAEETLTRISRDLGVGSPKGIHVFLVSSQEQWESMQPKGNRVPRWAAGLAYPKWRLIYLRQALGGNPIDVETTLKHEIAHLAFHKAIGKTEVPKWFHEGLAMYYAGEFGFDRFGTLSYALALGHTFSLKDLDSNFPRAVNDVHVAYAQSIAFVNYLVSEFEPDAFRNLVQRLSQREDFYKALSSSFGKPLDELEASWRKSMKLHYAWIPAITSSGFIWSVASVLFLWGYAKRRKEKARRRAELEREEALWEQAFPTNPSPSIPSTQPEIAQAASAQANDLPSWVEAEKRRLSGRETHLRGLRWRLGNAGRATSSRWIYSDSASDWSGYEQDADDDQKPTIH